MENYTFLRESAITPDGREQLEALGLNLLLLITVYSTSLDLNLQFLMDYPFQKQEGLISVTRRLKSKVGQPTTMRLRKVLELLRARSEEFFTVKH